MFRLYLLPILVLQQVIRSMELRDMFVMCLASRRSKRFLKSCIPKNTVRIKLWFEDGIVFKSDDIVFLTCQPVIYDNFREHQIGTELMLFEFWPSFAYCRWEHNADHEKIIKNLLASIAEMFNSPVVALVFSQQYIALELIQYAKHLQLPIDTINYQPIVPPEQAEIDEFLSECSTVSKLYLKGNFEYYPPTPDFLKVDALRIIYFNYWTQLEDFLQCKHVWFVARSSFWTVDAVDSHELNDAFGRMIETECRLEYFMIQPHRPINVTNDAGIIFEGLGDNQVIMGPNAERILNIDRKDGKKSVITVTEMCVELRPQNDTTDYRLPMWEDF